MERDDTYEYSLDAHHSEETGKKLRKKIWMVTLWLTIITTVEVFLGVFYGSMEWLPWSAVKLIFIGLTVVKAGYIVMKFMHLGDERKSFKLLVLVPYIAFMIYLIYICLVEAMYIQGMDTLFG